MFSHRRMFCFFMCSITNLSKLQTEFPDTLYGLYHILAVKTFRCRKSELPIEANGHKTWFSGNSQVEQTQGCFYCKSIIITREGCRLIWIHVSGFFIMDSRRPAQVLSPNKKAWKDYSRFNRCPFVAETFKGVWLMIAVFELFPTVEVLILS